MGQTVMANKPNDDEKTEKKKGGKTKKLLLVGMGTLIVLGAGVGAGVYASGTFMATPDEKKEDPNRPKLVERSDEAEAPAEGEEGKDPPPKVGTVAVKSDQTKVDPKRFEITYFAMEQPFTANLADGSGFVQMGLSLSTYYDGKVIANIKRQTVPIRSSILMVLSEQDAAVVSTPMGKQMLQRQLTDAINEVLRQKEGFGGIDNVYFSSLVIQ
jgi:flagellar protein FliL